MNYLFPFALLVSLLLSSFSVTESKFESETDPKAKELVEKLQKAIGTWNDLASQGDVQYTYVYRDFTKGTDLSTERYIFQGETSWGEYTKHEVNVLPKDEGIVRQLSMNGQAKLSLNNEIVSDDAAINFTGFLRTANYFWFTMMYKVDDPGTIHRYLGQEEINGTNYDKVSLSYDPEILGKEVNDEFVLFFNPDTNLVDRYLFSFPDRGLNEPVLLMELDYSKIDDLYIATTRRLFAPSAEGEYKQIGEFLSQDITFNNGFTAADLTL